MAEAASGTLPRITTAAKRCSSKGECRVGLGKGPLLPSPPLSFLSRTISRSLYSKSQRHLVFENTMTTTSSENGGGGGGGGDGNKLIVSILAVPAEEQPDRSQPKKRQTVSIAAPPHSSSNASQKSRLVLLMVLMEAATLGQRWRRHTLGYPWIRSLVALVFGMLAFKSVASSFLPNIRSLTHHCVFAP